MARIKVSVTERDIAVAKPKDSAHCMIADAVKAAVPDAEHVSVDLQTIRYTRIGKRYFYLTPRSAQEALLRFDAGDETLGPFSFWLPNPAQIRQSGAAARADRRARLTRSGPTGSEGVPSVRGGASPPLGPLVGGDKTVIGRAAEKTTGRIRAFGLRGMGRVVSDA